MDWAELESLIDIDLIAKLTFLGILIYVGFLILQGFWADLVSFFDDLLKQITQAF